MQNKVGTLRKQRVGNKSSEIGQFKGYRRMHLPGRCYPKGFSTSILLMGFNCDFSQRQMTPEDGKFEISSMNLKRLLHVRKVKIDYQ